MNPGCASWFFKISTNGVVKRVFAYCFFTAPTPIGVSSRHPPRTLLLQRSFFMAPPTGVFTGLFRSQAPHALLSCSWTAKNDENRRSRSGLGRLSIPQVVVILFYVIVPRVRATIRVRPVCLSGMLAPPLVPLRGGVCVRHKHGWVGVASVGVGQSRTSYVQVWLTVNDM